MGCPLEGGSPAGKPETRSRRGTQGQAQGRCRVVQRTPSGTVLRLCCERPEEWQLALLRRLKRTPFSYTAVQAIRQLTVFRFRVSSACCLPGRFALLWLSAPSRLLMPRFIATVTTGWSAAALTGSHSPARHGPLPPLSQASRISALGPSPCNNGNWRCALQGHSHATGGRLADSWDRSFLHHGPAVRAPPPGAARGSHGRAGVFQETPRRRRRHERMSSSMQGAQGSGVRCWATAACFPWSPCSPSQVLRTWRQSSGDGRGPAPPSPFRIDVPTPLSYFYPSCMHAASRCQSALNR